MRIVLAGEGKHERGGWTDRPPFRQIVPAPGMLVALLERAGCDHEVLDGRVWKDIPLFAAGGHASREQRRMRRLRLDALEAGARVVVWVRDRDGDRARERELNEAAAEPHEVSLAGGVAVESIDAWILALQGASRPDFSSRPKIRAGYPGVAERVELVRRGDLKAAAARSPSLRRWLAAIHATWKPGET